jgi:long-chain acyl-CoA synthetase
MIALPDTVPELLAARVRDTPDQPAFLTPAAPGAWQPVTWAAFAADVERLARALHGSGVGPGTRVAILARTSVEWERAQMAALRLGAVVIGIDPNYPDDTLALVLDATAPEILFVDDATTAARVPPAARARLRRTLGLREDSYSGTDALPTAIPAAENDAIVTFSSGTTGVPKPIVYTHAQVLLAVRSIVEAFPDIGPGSRLACWLPLANLFQRIIDFCAMARGAASYVVPDPREIVKHLPTINPHVFIGVPRFFEKVQAGIDERLEGGIARWALACGRRRAAGAGKGIVERMRFALADRLVLRRVRRVFGAEVRYLISGSAPMPLWLLEWYDAIGLTVFEAYGVSENIVPVAMNRPGARRLGTVGPPMPPNELRLAADGEVMVRGAGVFRGYLGSEGGARPNAEGFWATGDLGEQTADGFLRLTGRKTDAFKTSTGRWIVPATVEAHLGRAPYVEYAVVVRSGTGAPVAILNVDPSKLDRSAAAERVARDAATALADLPSYSRPAGFLVVMTPFTIAAGDLTTNLKLRRTAIAERFRPQLDQLLVLPAPAVLVA